MDRHGNVNCIDLYIASFRHISRSIARKAAGKEQFLRWGRIVIHWTSFRESLLKYTGELLYDSFQVEFWRAVIFGKFAIHHAHTVSAFIILLEIFPRFLGRFRLKLNRAAFDAHCELQAKTKRVIQEYPRRRRESPLP